MFRQSLMDQLAIELGERFHCHVRVVIPNLCFGEDKERCESALRNLNSPLILSGRDLLIPLVLNDELAAVIVLENGIEMDANDMALARQVFDQLVSQKGAHEHGVKKQPGNSFVYQNKQGVEFMNNSFLIEAPLAAPTRELALEIHRFSKQMFFLPLEALGTEGLKTVDDLVDLGALTLYVDDLTRIDLQTQSVLARYFKEVPAESRDLKLVAVIRSDIFMAMEAGLLNAELVAVLNGNLVTWPSHLVQGKNPSDMMEYFLTQRTTQPSGRPRLTVLQGDLH
ncbi:MAG: hypothetical protein K2X47_12130 [Bdellovibrionales bacterium]|nr:hypothetical protein [Bdellovibrionales bacterium]